MTPAAPTERQYRDVFGFVRRRVRSRSDAEDLTQQVFEDYAATLRKSAESAPPTLGWLYTVAQRRIADEARRHRRSLTVALTAIPDIAAPGNAYERRVAVALDRALAEMSEGQRRVVISRLLQGATFHEIAHKLDISEEACRMRFLRGLAHLRSELEKEGLP